MAATRRRRVGRPAPAGPADERAEAADARPEKWTLLTSHGRVLLLIARDPELKVREIAEQARITERAASGITADLEAAGYITKRREGRRTTYVVHPDVAFRHPAEAGHRVSELIQVFTH